MKAPKCTLVALMLAAGVGLGTQERVPQLDSIRRQDLERDVNVLASDRMRGRMMTTPENARAATWIASRFEQLSLRPVGPRGAFFHPFDLDDARLGSANAVITRRSSSVETRTYGRDFYPQRFSVSGRISGEVVFAGYGVHASALGHDDYRGEVKDRIVLVFDHDPGEHDPASPFDGLVSSQAGTAVRKALAAQEAGAAAILYVPDLHNHVGPFDFESATRTSWPGNQARGAMALPSVWTDQVRIPALAVSPGMVSGWLEGSGRSLPALARLAEQPGGMSPIPLDVQLELTADVMHERIQERNVLGILEGQHPSRRAEVVVISAHFDHLGADATGVFAGADDNASGVAAMLDIAEAFVLAARAGRRPDRSVLFASWNAEERGLFGAWAYAEAPVIPMAQTVAVLNMDMIGRAEEVPEDGGARFNGLQPQAASANRDSLNVIGTTRSPDLAEVISAAGMGSDLDLRMRYDNNASNLMRRSDHWPFLQHGVPALWFHTGLHPDYHTVRDRPERIDFGKVERIARLVYQSAWTLAQQETRPRYVSPRLSTPH